MVACDWFFNMNLTQVLIPLGKRASVLAAKGTVDIILRVVVNTSKDTSVCTEEILLLSHVILTKVGPKGKILYMPFKSIKEGSYVSSKTFEFLESFSKALKVFEIIFHSFWTLKYNWGTFTIVQKTLANTSLKPPSALRKWKSAMDSLWWKKAEV